MIFIFYFGAKIYKKYEKNKFIILFKPKKKHQVET